MAFSIPHLSFSSIDSFVNCPRGWWHRYILKEQAAQTDAARFGTQFDQLVSSEWGLCEAPKTLLPGVEEAVAIYMASEAAKGLVKPDAAQKAITITPEQWEMYAELYGANPAAIPWVKYIGFLDLTGTDETGLLRWVVDLKTSDRKGLKVSWALQSVMYALHEGAQRAEIHLVTRTKVPAVYRYGLPLHAGVFAWALTTLGGYACAMKKILETAQFANDLPARGDYWCGWCAANLKCAGAHMQTVKES